MGRDIPINMPGHDVRALLEGRKAQHRLPITSVRTAATPESRAYTMRGADLDKALDRAAGFRRVHGDLWSWSASAFNYQVGARTNWLAHIGFATGDRLWVRECWSDQDCCECEVMYRATACDDGLLPDEAAETRWRSSTHMPRWASRVTLAVEDVRVQRLQDISEADAIAEGAEPCSHGYWFDRRVSLAGSDARGAFYCLWSEKYGGDPQRVRPHSWRSNPWVVAISFRVERANIEALKVAA